MNQKITFINRKILNNPLASFYLVVIVTITLAIFGLIMVLSASSVTSYTKDGSPYSLVKNQFFYVIVGFILFILVLYIPIDFIRLISTPILYALIITLILVLIPGIGTKINGSRRWFAISGFTIQPSEFIKVALCVWGASILADKLKSQFVQIKDLVFPLVPVTFFISFLIILEPNLSTTITIAIITIALLWFSGLPTKIMFLGFLALIGMVIFLAITSSYRSARLATFLGKNYDPLGKDYQSIQAKFAFAKGGLFGTGLGRSESKFHYLPNAHNDFIFAIIGEELGLIGSILVIILFLLISYVGVRITLRSVDPFLQILTSTITTLILAQAFINISYEIGLLPVTGIQLPLLSAGGTSTTSMLVLFGLLASAARAEPEAIAAIKFAHKTNRKLFILPAPKYYLPTKKSQKIFLDQRVNRGNNFIKK